MVRTVADALERRPPNKGVRVPMPDGAASSTPGLTRAVLPTGAADGGKRGAGVAGGTSHGVGLTAGRRVGAAVPYL